MDGRADATETLRKHPAFTGIAATQNLFQATPHGATGPGFLDCPTIDFDINAQVPFDASDWIAPTSNGSIALVFASRVLLSVELKAVAYAPNATSEPAACWMNCLRL